MRIIAVMNNINKGEMGLLHNTVNAQYVNESDRIDALHIVRIRSFATASDKIECGDDAYVYGNYSI